MHVNAVRFYLYSCVTQSRNIMFPSTQLLSADRRPVTVINDKRNVSTVAAALNGDTCRPERGALLVSFCLIPQVNASTYLQPEPLNGFSRLQGSRRPT